MFSKPKKKTTTQMTLKFTRQCYLFDTSGISIGYSSILGVIINIKPKVPVTGSLIFVKFGESKNVQKKYVPLTVSLTQHATDL